MEQSAISCMAERKTINFGIQKKKEIGCKFIFGTILYKRKQYHLAGSLFKRFAVAAKVQDGLHIQQRMCNS